MRLPNAKWLRPIALAVFLAGAWWVGLATGFADKLSEQGLEELSVDTGLVGLAIFLGLFCVGTLLQIPGGVFLVASLFIYGYWGGMVVCYVGGLLAISLTFAMSRTIGGIPTMKFQNRRLQSILTKLEEQPIRTMALLRVFMMISPALCTTLTLCGVRYRDYFVAAVIGLPPPILFMATLLQFFRG